MWILTRRKKRSLKSIKLLSIFVLSVPNKCFQITSLSRIGIRIGVLCYVVEVRMVSDYLL